MSIEQQLQQHFHKRADKLTCPKAIDVQVQKMMHSKMDENPAYKLKLNSRRLPRFAIIAIVILLLCGFAFTSSQLLFKADKGNVSYEWYVDSTLALKYITGAEIRESLNYVKSQLATGETAVVYLSDFAKEKHPLIKQHPLLSVTNPNIETNFDRWNSTLALALYGYKLPSDLPDSYTFAGGKSGYPILWNTITPNEDQLTDSLRKEAKETGSKMVWQKISPIPSPITAYTSIYNIDGDEVYVTMELYPENLIRVESLTHEAMTYEQISINGRDMFYSYSKNLFSESDQYQDLFWMESINGQTVAYRIGTTSTTLTQDDLALIANHMN